MTFSAEARVIAVFTLLTALLLGVWRDVTELVSGLLGAQTPDFYEGDVYSVITSLVVVAVPAVATVFARAATAATEPGWARHLGQAAVMLGIVTTVAGLLRIVTLFL